MSRQSATRVDQLDVPWARGGLGRAIRAVMILGVFRAITGFYTRVSVTGREHLVGLPGPVLFVATHASHMDTPMLLAALPRACRGRTLVAAAADYFYASRPLAHAVSVAFGTVPIQRGAGLAGGDEGPVPGLLREGWNLVIFAEGTRSRDGSIGRLRGGAAVLAAEYDCPIVPVRISGTHAAMPPGRGWPRRLRVSALVRRRHPVEIRFGAPIRVRDGETRRQVMERVRLALAPGQEDVTERRSARLRSRVPPG
jgi:1-acyl-sn-glycerol-3-phosphate acyltransferase